MPGFARLNARERERERDLGVGEMGVLADLGGDGGAELGDGDDIVEVVDFDDGGNGSAGRSEEVENFVPSFLQTC